MNADFHVDELQLCSEVSEPLGWLEGFSEIFASLRLQTAPRVNQNLVKRAGALKPLEPCHAFQFVLLLSDFML